MGIVRGTDTTLIFQTTFGKLIDLEDDDSTSIGQLTAGTYSTLYNTTVQRHAFEEKIS